MAALKILENFFKHICLFFMTENCYIKFFVEFNFFHVKCLKAVISKVLGFGLILGSMFVKVPQILKIYNASSGMGISIHGASLELCALLASVSYSFVNKYPFSSYGDAVFLLLQTTLICSMVMFYDGAKRNAVSFFLIVFASVSIFCSGLVSLEVLWFLQACNIPFVFFAKMIQAFLNYKNGSTGQLSAVTTILLFLGSSARIFTSIQETGDFVIICTYSAATAANAVLCGQLWWYWNVAVTDTKKKQ